MDSYQLARSPVNMYTLNVHSALNNPLEAQAALHSPWTYHLTNKPVLTLRGNQTQAKMLHLNLSVFTGLHPLCSPSVSAPSHASVPPVGPALHLASL